MTDSALIREVIDRCVCCRVGFNDGGEVYIVPLNFGYEKAGEGYTFYFHSACEGRKIDLIAKNSAVGFEMDTGYVLHPEEDPAACANAFQSIIGTGKVSLVTDREEKTKGLSLLMAHTAGRPDCTFTEKMMDGVAVFKLEVAQMACKTHL